MPEYIDFVPTSVLVTVFVTQMRFQKCNAYILWNTVLCHFRMTFSVFCILVAWLFVRQGPISIYTLSPQHLCLKSNLNRGCYINFFCLYWHAELIISSLKNWRTLDSWLFNVCACMQSVCRNEVLTTAIISVLGYLQPMGLFCFCFQAEMYIWNSNMKHTNEAKIYPKEYKLLTKKEQRAQKQTHRLIIITVSPTEWWSIHRMQRRT